jgi:hypothetical protein
MRAAGVPSPEPALGPAGSGHLMVPLSNLLFRGLFLWHVRIPHSVPSSWTVHQWGVKRLIVTHDEAEKKARKFWQAMHLPKQRTSRNVVGPHVVCAKTLLCAYWLCCFTLMAYVPPQPSQGISYHTLCTRHTGLSPSTKTMVDDILGR